jgi:Uma2 family endonuclease
MSTVTTKDDPSTIDEPITHQRRSQRGEPTWEIAGMYPRQGEWTEEQYFAVESNYFVEFVDGVLEFLTMPTLSHQKIAKFLFLQLVDFVESRRLGKVQFAPLPVKLFKGRVREPDIVCLNYEQMKSAKGKYPKGADLVVEVVSPDHESQKRDHEVKPLDYAKAGVKEYWIVDPETRTVKVLTLACKKYKTHGEFRSGQVADSVLFDGFSLNVDDVFAAAEDSGESIA